MLLSTLSANQKIDFILYIGADEQNETVFNFLNKKRSEQYFMKGGDTFISVIGRQITQAQYYIESTDEVTNVLGVLKNAT